MRRGWPRVLAGRLLLLALGVCLAVVLLEGLLRLGATLMPARQDHPAWLGGARRILCLGDSKHLWAVRREVAVVPEGPRNAVERAVRGSAHRGARPGVPGDQLVQDAEG